MAGALSGLVAIISGRRIREAMEPPRPLTPQEISAQDDRRLDELYREARAKLAAVGVDVDKIQLDRERWMILHPEWCRPMTIHFAQREDPDMLAYAVRDLSR